MDIIGQRFGRLVVKGMASRDSRGKYLWLCDCDCGQRTIVSGDNLRSGHTKSCGCLRGENHGRAGTSLYKLWSEMKRRCNNPNSEKYANYGGRGIRVCDKWADSFEAFRQDVGPRPSSRHSLDRIDNNGDYEPGNVRWATPIEQANNTRCNRRLTFRGETATMAEWGRRVDISPVTLHMRLKRGWSVKRALTEPVRS
jgi:hypothetical protein